MMRPLVVVPVSEVAPLEVQPATAVLGAKKGGTVTYVIGGGTPTYTVTSNNPGVVPVMAATGNGFTVKLKNGTAPGTVTFTVTDSTTPIPKTASATLTII